MKIRYGHLHIDQIYTPGTGWRDIAPIPLSRLDAPIRSHIAPAVTRVRIVGRGDYTIAELLRATRHLNADGDSQQQTHHDTPTAGTHTYTNTLNERQRGEDSNG